MRNAALPLMVLLSPLAEAQPSQTSAQERRYLYYSDEAQRAQLTALIAPLKAQDKSAKINCEWVWIKLPRKVEKQEHIDTTAKAIAHGVSQSPCLVLASPQGQSYNQLRLTEITPAQYRKAKATPTPQPQERQLHAALYRIYAQAQLNQLEGKELQKAIALCQAEFARTDNSLSLRQYIGLNYLYPLLLLHYSQYYQGGHTPESEQRLLNAISALEAVRDLDPLTIHGRNAHQERERQRKARLQARRYD